MFFNLGHCCLVSAFLFSASAFSAAHVLSDCISLILVNDTVVFVLLCFKRNKYGGGNPHLDKTG